MEVLITGLDGLLGISLMRFLPERKYEVSVLMHPLSKSETLGGHNIQRQYGDIFRPESLLASFTVKHAVIHSVVSTTVWPARSEASRQMNVAGTRNIIEACLQHSIKRLVFIGSASSVSTRAKPGEKHSFPEVKFGLDYIDSKYEAFRLVMKAVKTRLKRRYFREDSWKGTSAQLPHVADVMRRAIR